MAKLFSNSKAKAALARASTINATLPVDAEARISSLEAIDHWHTNLTQLDKVRGYSGFTFFSDGRGLSFVVKTANYIVTTTDSGVICDASGGDITVTLPIPSSCFDSSNLASIIYDIHKLDSSANTVTILPYATETIAGHNKIVLSRPNETVEIATDGTNWIVRNRDRIYEGSKQTYKQSSIVVSDIVVANTIAETTIFTSLFDADELKSNDMIETNISGYYSTANASDIFTARIKINGSTIHTFSSVAKNVTNTPVDMSHKFTVRTDGATGTISCMANFAAFNDGLFGADTLDTSINTTIANSITITMQWGAANVSNSGTIKQGICRING